MKTINTKVEQRLLLCALEHPKAKIRNKILGEAIVEDFGSEYGIETREVMDAQLQRGKGLGTALDFAEMPSLSPEAQDFIQGTSKSRRRAMRYTEDQVDGLIYKLKTTRRLRDAFRGVEAASAILMASKITENGFKKFKNILEDTLMKMDEGFDQQPMHHLGTGQSKEDLQDLIKRTNADRKTSLIATGMDVLDQAYGGFARGNVVTVSANSGGGKTALALNLSVNMALKGLNSLYCSLEMSEAEATDRISANIAQVPHENIRLGQQNRKQKKRVAKAWKRFWKASRKLNGRLTVWDKKDSDFTPQQLEISAKPFKYDVIVIDYITLFANKYGDTWKMQMEYSRFLKQMAKRLNCVVIILTQLNEDDQIKYGKSIKENTDYWFYWRYEEEEEEDGQTEMKTGKARHSRKKNFTLNMALETMTITGSLEEIPITGNRIPPTIETKRDRKKGKKGKKGKKRSRSAEAVRELGSF